MPIPFAINAISGNYPDIAVNYDNNFYRRIFLLTGILYPLGEPISLQRHRCSPFAVVCYGFMGYFLASAAILTRELSRMILS
jgi:hypothetical protein